MEDWDQEKLEQVVASKSNEYNKNKPTDIVSLSITLPILLSHCGYVILLEHILISSSDSKIYLWTHYGCVWKKER